ncbi:hypothetical protein [Bradyrhizobium prioriisuperbiae]|uniref:hypothetical protein n=1 Tax=Bradyrhizobium prioriisuperbiae TaxID=2854389 RepID=UPI0028E47350|nr:hypothetical protein [Bradyrhizobium prioritasuperba]
MAVISFVLPSGDDGSLAGPTKVVSQTRQTMPDNGVMFAGLSGDSGGHVKAVVATDPSALTIEDLGTSSAGIRWFRLTRRHPGHLRVDAKDHRGFVLAAFLLIIKPFSNDGPPVINLPKASGPMEFEIDPDDARHPNLINVHVSTPKDDADYIDRRMTGIGYNIYLFGFHVVCSGLELPVYVPDTLVDLSLTKAEPIDGKVYDSIEQAQAAIRAAPQRAGGPARFAYYRGAGGAVIAPTVFSPATTPRIIATYFGARRLYATYVENEMVGLAIGIVGGLVIRAIVGRILRASNEDPFEPPGNPPKTTLPPAVERLKTTATDLQNKNPVRTVEVLTKPATFRHTLTASPQQMSYARIEMEGSMRLSTGGNAHYGEGVYAWPANRPGSGTYIDIEVPPGTGVETLNVAGTKWVRLLPPQGNTLPVRIVGTNMPKADIEFGRKMVRLPGPSRKP